MLDSTRGALATLGSAPWRRAPRLLLRRPGVLATVAGACTVLVAAVAAVPLFLSSVGSGAIEVQTQERCPTDTGATHPTEWDDPAPRDPFMPLADRLGPSTWWRYFP